VDEAFGAEVLEVGVGGTIEVLECIFSNFTSIFNSFQSVFLGVFLDGSSALIVTSASSGRFESSTSDGLDALLVFLEEVFSFVFSVVDEASEAEVLEIWLETVFLGESSVWMITIVLNGNPVLCGSKSPWFILMEVVSSQISLQRST